MDNDVTYSWFAVLANPVVHGYQGTPQQICEQLRDEWIQDSTTRTGAWAYCISADGLHHVHMVLEDNTAMRFSKVKRTYAIGAYLEPTKGTKKQAEDYIYKRHPYTEKGEEVICVVTAGAIKGNPGKRSDLDTISSLIAEGLTPQEIMDVDFKYRRYAREIKDAFFRRRWTLTPPVRKVGVHLLVGDSGNGKTFKYVQLCEEIGEEHICMISDHSVNGGFDHYMAEKVLFIDEYKGQFPYSMFLLITDCYKVQVHARYSNAWTLWDEVYITSVFPPEKLYELMVPPDRRAEDSRDQMYRRITDITYCYKMGDEYKRYTIPMSQYRGYEDLQAAAIFPQQDSLF